MYVLLVAVERMGITPPSPPLLSLLSKTTAAEQKRPYEKKKKRREGDSLPTHPKKEKKEGDRGKREEKEIRRLLLPFSLRPNLRRKERKKGISQGRKRGGGIS